MLRDFVQSNREELISRSRAKVSARRSPSTSTDELEQGVPLFLTQLSETLRLDPAASPVSSGAIAAGAARQGRALLALGSTISEVAHGYADVCEAITELAVERRVPITAQECHTLTRCLDTAVAEAVTEYARLRDEATAHHDLEHRGEIAHALRNRLHTALLSLKVLEAGKVGASGGSAGALLARSLAAIGDLADGMASELREEASPRTVAGPTRGTSPARTASSASSRGAPPPAPAP